MTVWEATDTFLAHCECSRRDGAHPGSLRDKTCRQTLSQSWQTLRTPTSWASHPSRLSCREMSAVDKTKPVPSRYERQWSSSTLGTAELEPWSHPLWGQLGTANEGTGRPSLTAAPSSLLGAVGRTNEDVSPCCRLHSTGAGRSGPTVRLFLVQLPFRFPEELVRFLRSLMSLCVWRNLGSC